MAGFYDWLHNALGSGVNGETTERLQPGPAPASPAQSALLGSYWPSEAPAQPMAAPSSPPAALPTFMQGQTPFAGPTPIPHPPGFVGETSPQPATQLPARAPMPPARPAEAGPPMPITPQAAPAAPEVSPWRKFSDMLAGNSDQLLYMGAGLLSTNNFGEGLMRGLQGASLAKATQARTDLARAKLARETQTLSGTAQWLMKVRPGLSPEQAIALASNDGVVRKIAEEEYAKKDPKTHLVDITNPDGTPGKGFVTEGETQVKPIAGMGTPGDTEEVKDGMILKKRNGVVIGVRPAQPTAAPGAPAVEGPPPGVDFQTWQKERAKQAVKKQGEQLERGRVAEEMVPHLQRAFEAYQKLAQSGIMATPIGPVSAMGANRMLGGMFGTDSEKYRQEYEAAAKNLELIQAQLKMKGQGTITENERKILAMTLPRLDAADPATGLKTLQDLYDLAKREYENGRTPRAPGAQPFGPLQRGQLPPGVTIRRIN